MRPYAERKEARIERLRARAASRLSQGHAAVSQAQARAERIPFGQPVLSGHYSEGRDRRFREKIRNGFTNGFAAIDEAKTLDRRADAAEASTAVSSDDPEALDKLRAKIEVLEKGRAAMIATNKALRSKAPAAALGEMGYGAALIAQLLEPDFAGRKGFPDYKLRNTGAEVARLRKRIAELEAKAVTPTKPPEQIGDIRIEESENRVRIFFPDKPGEATRAALKSAGFRWAPSEGAWQRHASSQAWHEARRIAVAP